MMSGSKDGGRWVFGTYKHVARVGFFPKIWLEWSNIESSVIDETKAFWVVR